jgi:hypothetical protein
VKTLENQGPIPYAPVGSWSTEGVARLVVYLRRQGVPVHQASVARNGLLSVMFEPHLAQAEILEGLLLAWPGIVAVERAGACVIHAYGPGLRKFRDEGRTRRPASLVRRWFR